MTNTEIQIPKAHLITYEGYAKVGKLEIRETVNTPYDNFRQAAETMAQRIHQNKTELFTKDFVIEIKNRNTNEVKKFKLSAKTEVIYKAEIVE